MENDKSSISQAGTYAKLGEYWDSHDLAEEWDRTSPAEFEVSLRSSATYVAVDRKLSDRVRAMASQHGVSSETLVNLWIQERLAEEAKAS